MSPFQRHTRRLWQRLQRWLTWLWEQEGSHGQRARGLAAGIFCGCFPFFGLQILLGVALASVVRGNHLLAAAGTWISNPLTYVPLYWFNYQLGSLLLGPGSGWPGLQALRHDRLWQLGGQLAARLLLGSTLVGVVCAVGFGWLYWHWLERKLVKKSVRR
ncbi:MAG: DUF2062 domain-containing protein [Cyanobium sp.]